MIQDDVCISGLYPWFLTFVLSLLYILGGVLNRRFDWRIGILTHSLGNTQDTLKAYMECLLLYSIVVQLDK